MSIIYDALNKIQNQNITKDKNTAAIKKSSKRNKKIFTVILPILLIASIGLFIQYNIRNEAVLKNIPDIKTIKMQEQSDIQQKEKNEQRLYLSGISFSNAQAMAIINDNVVEIGDSVEGAKVVNIDQQSVELEREGERFVLSMR